jgi:hypothetical protein
VAAVAVGPCIPAPPCYETPPVGEQLCALTDVSGGTSDLIEMGWGDVDWTCLAQDTDKWRALVNAVMNLRVQ